MKSPKTYSEYLSTLSETDRAYISLRDKPGWGRWTHWSGDRKDDCMTILVPSEDRYIPSNTLWEKFIQYCDLTSDN